MATIDWPEALVPQTAQLSLRKSGTQFASPFNGTMQAVDFIGERWALSCSLAQMTSRNPRGVGAFCNNLAGGVERVRVWPFHTRGVPRGTLRGAPSLTSAAARGHDSLAVGSAAHAVNLLRFPEDMRNTAEAGTGRPWVQFADADAGVALQSTTLPTGATGMANKLQLSSSGLAQRQIQQSVSTVPDHTVVCASVYVQKLEVWGVVLMGASKTPAYPAALYRLDTGQLISTQAGVGGETLVSHGIAPAGGDWWRVWWAWDSRSGGSSVTPIIGLVTTTGGLTSGTVGSGLLLWGAQLEYGSSPTAYTGHPTLLAGDFIGAGGQLFQVRADTQLVNGAGAVPVINRVRGTIASSSAVTWQRPTCEMVLPAMQAGPVWRPGAIESAALDLVEVW